MIRYAIYDAKLGVYWDSFSIGKDRFYDSGQLAIESWESDNPPKTLQKQQICFKNPITHEWCIPPFLKQCRFFVSAVEVDSSRYEIVKHNEAECNYEAVERNNKYGRTRNHETLCKRQGIVANPDDKTNPFINNLHR